MSLAIVTATLDYTRASDCLQSWLAHARDVAHPPTLYIVGQKPGVVSFDDDQWVDITGRGNVVTKGYRVSEVLGVVPAFAIGVQKALEDGHDVIACFHDDLEILDPGWDLLVTALFYQHPEIGLAGFGGGVGLADDDIYQTPYNPMQLARKGFVSNMRDAQVHGARSLQPLRVACLDGFSQIGRREYWQGRVNPQANIHPPAGKVFHAVPLFDVMKEWGIVHHAYDAALGCFAKRLGWEAWMLPIACHHYGGRTAVGDPRYHQWANAQRPDDAPEVGSGDQVFWNEAHQTVYNQFRDVLPIRLP